MGQPAGISITVTNGDVRTAPGDVLALKHAQGLYGADLQVVDALKSHGINVAGMLPKPASYHLVPAEDALRVKTVLFVGVNDLWMRFSYQDIREFSRSALTILATTSPDTSHLLLTVHGVNFGLDEGEAFEAQIAGLVDAVGVGDFPSDLRRITFVEISQGRAARLDALLSRLLPEGILPIPGRPGALSLYKVSAERFRSAGYLSASKPHVFVAMPFVDEMDDIFHYGIQRAVNAAGLLCERADYAIFNGDILTWIKERIESAELVIADLSGANANVYLEVGYAWGCGLPTVLLVRDPAELKFDVRGQRCIVYKKIKDLEEKLGPELAQLRPRGR
jgi:hypothetical protein